METSTKKLMFLLLITLSCRNRSTLPNRPKAPPITTPNIYNEDSTTDKPVVQPAAAEAIQHEAVGDTALTPSLEDKPPKKETKQQEPIEYELESKTDGPTQSKETPKPRIGSDHDEDDTETEYETEYETDAEENNQNATPKKKKGLLKRLKRLSPFRKKKEKPREPV